MTFGPQKSDAHRDEAIPQEATNDPELNPVWHWAFTITRLMSYPGYNPEWPIYTFYDPAKNRFSDLRSYEILDDIKAAVTAIGFDVLGFHADDVGTHSNRGAFAMMMYLSGVPVFTIMKMGRWLSDAFLKYIESQVLTFSHGVSKKMLFSDTFFNFPVKNHEKEQQGTAQTQRSNPRSISHYTQPARPQIYGRHSSSLRDKYRPPSWPIQTC